MTKERELGLTGPCEGTATLVIILYHACTLYGGAWFGKPATLCLALSTFVRAFRRPCAAVPSCRLHLGLSQD